MAQIRLYQCQIESLSTLSQPEPEITELKPSQTDKRLNSARDGTLFPKEVRRNISNCPSTENNSLLTNRKKIESYVIGDLKSERKRSVSGGVQAVISARGGNNRIGPLTEGNQNK